MIIFYRSRRTRSSRLAKKVCKRVENEGPQGDEGRGQPDPAGNVVRIRRDWFGPREDLVPFGPRASGTGVVELSPPAPVRPDDFWGEDSASIHDVLEGPGAAAPAPEARIAVDVASAPPRDSRSLVLPGALASVRRIGRRVRRAGAWIPRLPRVGLSIPRVRVSLPRVRFSIPRVRAVPLAAVGLAVFAGAAIVLAAVGATPGVSPQRAAVRGDQMLAGLSPAALAIAPVFPARPPTRHTASRHQAPAVRHRRRAPESKVGSSSPSSAALQGSGGTPAQPGTSQTAPPAASAAQATRTATGASAGSTGSEGSAPAGPQGPGAPFGPGHLG
jgi:hypothetical protein